MKRPWDHFNVYFFFQGIILAYDVTRKDSFSNIRKWLKYVEQYGEQNVKMSIVGNKIDLTDEREVTAEEAEQLADEFSIPWFETSAYTGQHIEVRGLSLEGLNFPTSSSTIVAASPFSHSNPQ